MVLDIDGSLHQIHSENKQEAAANYKGGYGFHPIYCFADATGETLAVALRPGNAGANNIADHVALLDAAIAGLPPEIAVGHRSGDDAGLVRRQRPVTVDELCELGGHLEGEGPVEADVLVVSRGDVGQHLVVDAPSSGS